MGLDRQRGKWRRLQAAPTLTPDVGSATREQWRAYLYLRANPCGWTTETWYHRAGCRKYIRVERHTETNEIRASRPSGQAQEATR